MGSYPGNGMGGESPDEEFQSQNHDESGSEPIGARIVSIPSRAGAVSVIPRPVDDSQADAPAPDPIRVVDAQRQQDAMARLADLVKSPTAAPPVLEQAPLEAGSRGSGTMAPEANAGAGSGGANKTQSTANIPAGTASAAARLPGTQAATGAGGTQPKTPATAAGPAKPGNSGTAGRGTQGSSSRGNAAATGAKQQNSGGQNAPTGKGGWIERGKDFIGQAEKSAKDAEDNVLSWFHRLMATQDGAAKKTGKADGGAGANSGQGAPAQQPELPKRGSDNHGEIGHEVSKRKPAKASASSEGGNNVFKPAEGQKIEDVVKEGYMLDDKGRAECVQLVKGLVGAPSTTQWKQGQTVTRGANIPPGTAIATFVKGSYPQGSLTRPAGQKGPYSDRHAAIYLGQTKEGIWVLDQDNKGRAIHTTLIPWDRPGKGNGNNASAFSVIEWPREKKK